MERELILTEDGSHSVQIKDSAITYHSVRGSIQESECVYIDVLRGVLKRQDSVRILEMGLGTGLNALLSFAAVEKSSKNIHYLAVEKFPLAYNISAALNYCRILRKPEWQAVLEQLHNSKWNQDNICTSNFIFHKDNVDILQFSADEPVDIVYYDAFAPEVQPELWTPEIFKKIFDYVKSGGILATYCSKVIVQRAMKAAGFLVEKAPGPRGKREIIRAFKP